MVLFMLLLEELLEEGAGGGIKDPAGAFIDDLEIFACSYDSDLFSIVRRQISK